MHLDFRVPNIWYRARLIQTSGPDAFEAAGVTLPGTPSIVAGSNRSIAWGFTNSYGEFGTVIRLVAVANDSTAYATALGPRPLLYVDEALEVRGGPTEHLKVAITQWGPVVGSDWQGRPYALQWTAQDPAATNLNLLKLEHAHSVEEAVRAAPGFGIPGQNLVIADSAGHIGWTLAGRLPAHSDTEPVGDAGLPQLSTDAHVGFVGWLAPKDQPNVIDPTDGLLWSANARVIGGPAARLIGDEGMDRGARAAQIHADLQQAPQALHAGGEFEGAAGRPRVVPGAMARAIERGPRAGSSGRRSWPGCGSRGSRTMEWTRRARRWGLSAGAFISRASRSACVFHARCARAPAGDGLSL